MALSNQKVQREYKKARLTFNWAPLKYEKALEHPKIETSTSEKALQNLKIESWIW